MLLSRVREFLIFSPDLFILDDPTSSLDNKVTADIMRAITEKPWDERTFVLSTNNTKLLDFVDRVIFMDRGQISFNGTPEEFRNNPSFQSYLKDSAEENKEVK